MNKQLQNVLILAAVGVGAYMLLRPKKVTTASPAADKMKLTCAEGEKLEEGLGGAPRCVPVSEVVSGARVCPVASQQGGLPQPKFDYYKRSADGTLNRFGNPNISGVPTNIVSNFASMAGVDIKANDFFTQKPGGFYR